MHHPQTKRGELKMVLQNRRGVVEFNTLITHPQSSNYRKHECFVVFWLIMILRRLL